MDIQPHFILIGIFLLVPAQYFLSSSNTSHVKYHLQSLLKTFGSFWKKSDLKDESILSKDIEDLEKENNYGLGEYLRERAPDVQFRVGDVIEHKVQDYKAVVIGWDATAIAPKEFIEKAHKGKTEWTNNPNYAVAIDTRDRLTPQIGYLVQENIKLSSGPVINPLVGKYFEKYDEKKQRYKMRPFVRKSYPDD